MDHTIKRTSSLSSSIMIVLLALDAKMNTKTTRQVTTTKASNIFQKPPLRKYFLTPASFTLNIKSTRINKFKIISAMIKKGFSSIVKPFHSVKIIRRTENNIKNM